MRLWVRYGIYACVMIAAGTWAASKANAQVLTFAPSATITAGMDDNVLWLPAGAPDTVWRVTPGFTASRESSRATWSANYSFDTERYQKHPELTTALARQTAKGEGKMQLSSQTTLSVNGGFDSSTTPFDLNTITGLTTSGRVDVWRRYVGADLAHDFGPASNVVLVYLLSGDFVSGGDTILTHSIDATFVHQITGRHAWLVKGIYRDYHFTGIDTQPATQSYGGLFGWKEKITPLTTLTVAAGPRRDTPSMTLHPEIQASLDRHVGAVKLAINYGQTSTTAIGVNGLVSLKRFFGSVELHLPGELDATLNGGTYLNAFEGQKTTAVGAGAEIARRVKGGVVIAVSYSTDVQKGLIGLQGLAVLPPGPDGSVSVVTTNPGQAVIRRNVVLLRLTFAPDIRPRRPPTER
jgi:hypothetical protein